MLKSEIEYGVLICAYLVFFKEQDYCAIIMLFPWFVWRSSLLCWKNWNRNFVSVYTWGLWNRLADRFDQNCVWGFQRQSGLLFKGMVVRKYYTVENK